MSVSYKDMRNERQWKATTGLSQPHFVSLCAAFKKTYEQLHEISLEYGTEEQKQEIALNTYEDALYFVLFQLKNGLTWDCLGVLFSLDGSNACRNFQKYLAVLEVALHQEGAMPKRSFRSVAELKKYLQAEEEVIVDVTEYRMERPTDKEKQKAHYSGKKKPTR